MQCQRRKWSLSPVPLWWAALLSAEDSVSAGTRLRCFTSPSYLRFPCLSFTSAPSLCSWCSCTPLAQPSARCKSSMHRSSHKNTSAPLRSATVQGVSEQPRLGKARTDNFLYQLCLLVAQPTTEEQPGKAAVLPTAGRRAWNNVGTQNLSVPAAGHFWARPWHLQKVKSSQPPTLCCAW